MRIDSLKLRTEMFKQGLSQKKLAEMTGVSRVTINGIASGRSCRDELGVKIAYALGVKPDDLMP